MSNSRFYLIQNEPGSPDGMGNGGPPSFSIVRADVITNGKCMRNHAAHLGMHVTDGCVQYMPLQQQDQLDSRATLACAACGCHRNYHPVEVRTQIVWTGTTPPPHLPPPPPAQGA